jgi:hypothetical protein
MSVSVWVTGEIIDCLIMEWLAIPIHGFGSCGVTSMIGLPRAGDICASALS